MIKDKCFVFVDFLYDPFNGTTISKPKKIKSVCLLSLNERIYWQDVEEHYRLRIEMSNSSIVYQTSPEDLLKMFTDCEYYIAISRKELYELAYIDRIYDVREKVIDKYFPEYKI